MDQAKHIIRRQTVDFQYNGNADGFALQKEVSDWCKLTLIPEIEQQFELFDFGDNYVTIDKLEIDASVNKRDWQQQIRNEVIAGISNKLRDYKHAVRETKEDHRISNRSYKFDELILFYFEKGYLPWWSKAFIESDFGTLLLKWIAEDKPADRSAGIISKLQQIYSGPVIERIVNQVPQALFFKWLKHFFKNENTIINEAEFFLKEILKASHKAEQKKITTANFQQVILALLIKDKGKIDIELAITIFHAKQAGNTYIFDDISKAAGKNSLQTNSFANALKKLLTAEAKPKSKKIPEAEISERNSKKGQLTAHQSQEENQEQVAADLREGIYVENAGLVIVAAFLPMLFDRLMITAHGVVVKPDLGALMIQYIVSGKTKSEEHELLLPKILCGIGSELPVNTNKRISALQKAEANEMLRSVIEHWTAIKNTSIEGLRTSFLQRSGKLVLVDDEWLLQVEQKSYDMLLQQLPWNISMIKLPWMKMMLKTEWVSK